MVRSNGQNLLLSLPYENDYLTSYTSLFFWSNIHLLQVYSWFQPKIVSNRDITSHIICLHLNILNFQVELHSYMGEFAQFVT